ncbi:MAG: SDR family NAD(P)-dependent oxidoreductase [Thermoleophilaceae bacterium]
MTSTASPPLALVTGASSGIGQAYAERLASEGRDLVIVARRADPLDELKRRLEAEHGVSVDPLVADLSTESGMSRVDAVAADARLETVIDNAALAHYMSFLELPSESAQELVKLNALAPLRLIHAALPGMVERGRGTVVSIATQLVFSASADNTRLPKRAVYTATKTFLFTLIRLLELELRGSGVRLQVVCPGVVRTEFHTRQNMDMSHMPRLEPEQVVQASMRGLKLGEVVCLPSLEEVDRLERRDQSDLDVLAGGMRPALASRYLIDDSSH